MGALAIALIALGVLILVWTFSGIPTNNKTSDQGPASAPTMSV